MLTNRLAPADISAAPAQYIASYSTTASGATATFSNCNIGAADEDRVIVLAVG